MFDKFKSLDIFDDRFAVTSHAQIHGSLFRETSSLRHCAKHCPRFVESQWLLKCLQVPAICSHRAESSSHSQVCVLFICVFVILFQFTEQPN
jgi:hypothetical protein